MAATAIGGRKVAAGFGWMAVMSYSANILGLLTTLILAKLLTPQEFGIVGLASMSIEVLRLLKDMGLSEAIVYQKREDHLALDTANTILVGFNVLLFVIAAAAAPLVARYYDRPIIMPVLIIMASNLVWDALRAVPRALLRKNLEFRRAVTPELVPIFISTAVSIGMAFAGFGVWSLVVKTVLHSLLGAWMMRGLAVYAPGFRFDRTAAREMLSYGHVIASTSVLLVILYNVDRFYVSRFAGLAALGAFELAMRIAEMPIKNFTYLVGSVMFPVFSKLDDARPMLRNAFLKTLRYTAFISVPAAVGLSLYGPALIDRIYGPRWAAMMVPLRILAIYALFRSLSTIVLDAFKATGNPKLMQRVTVVKLASVAGLGIPVLQRFGVVGLCWLILATYVLAFMIELRLLTRLLELQTTRVLGVLAAPVALSVTIPPAVYYALGQMFPVLAVPHLIVGIIVTLLLYLAGVYLADKRLVSDVRAILRPRVAV